MNKFRQLSFFVFLILLTACTSNTEMTPTPFPATSTRFPGDANSPLIAVEISELVANPENYEGSLVAVNGRYRRLPPHVCSTIKYNPPSTWGLTADELVAYMNGYDAQLESLLPENTSLSVTGIWRQWHGPVGCGKEAQVKDIWYLEVKRIVSPSPLTRITLTPMIPGEATAIADAGNEPPHDSEQITPAASPVGGEVTPTVSGFLNPPPTDSTDAPATPIIPVNGTLPAPATPTSEFGGSGGDVNQTPTAITTTATAPLPILTPDRNSTATPTTGNQSTPQPTPDPLATSTAVPQTNTTAKGEIIPFDVEFEQLNAQQSHEWEFELFLNETFTVTVATDPNTEILLSIFDQNNIAIVNRQNSSPSTALEVAVAKNAMAGTYRLLVESSGNTAGYYAMSVIDTDSLNNLPTANKGMLADGDAKTATLEVDFEDNWYFYAESGDIISITIEPFDNNADMWITLYNDDVDPDGPIVDVDSRTPGATEELINFSIPLNGVYLISTAEFDYNEVDYEISLTIN